MNSRPFRPAIAALALGVICTLAGPVPSASADSAIISAVDAGGGQIPCNPLDCSGRHSSDPGGSRARTPITAGRRVGEP